MFGPVFVRVTGLVRLKVVEKSPSHAKNKHASDSNGSRSARATHILGCTRIVIIFSLEGQEAANHVLPQPCRRRCALRFLGQCLHVSFSDTASTDAIYLCACLEGASRPSSLSPRGRPRGDDIIGLSKNDSELWATGSMLWTNAETDCCRVACPCIHEPSLTPLLIVPFLFLPNSVHVASRREAAASPAPSIPGHLLSRRSAWPMLPRPPRLPPIPPSCALPSTCPGRASAIR